MINITGNVTISGSMIYSYAKSHQDNYEFVDVEFPSDRSAYEAEIKAGKENLANNFRVVGMGTRNSDDLIGRTFQVSVKIPPAEPKRYTYKVLTGWDVSIGDDLVVNSPKTGLTVVKVMRVMSKEAYPASYDSCKWVVSKVSTKLYNALSALDEEKKTKTIEEKRLQNEQIVKLLRLENDYLVYLRHKFPGIENESKRADLFRKFKDGLS